MLREASTVDHIRSVVAPDFNAVNQRIEHRLYSNVELIQQVSHHIIHSGGKRLRPLLVLLSARALGYQGHDHIELATIIEFLHTATLLHDDVVDSSELRRGKRTANAVWGNPASVLVGDFLYSRAFQMMANLNSSRVIEVLADATNTIAEGEVLQLMNCKNPTVTEENYFQVIRYKTAKLFEAAATLGAIAANCATEQELAIANYGLHLGMAYQLIDDVLDYSADSEKFGKNLGVDLAEGKPTLPLIYSMQKGTHAQTELIRNAIMNGSVNELEPIMAIIKSTGALEHARSIAEQHADIALHSLNQLHSSPYRDTLQMLAQFVVQRQM